MITNLINKKATWEALWKLIGKEFLCHVVLGSNVSSSWTALKKKLAFCNPVSALQNINLIVLFQRSFQTTDLKILVHDR